MASKSELVDAVSQRCQMGKTEAQHVVDAVLAAITKSLSRGEEVRLTGFGSFSVARRAARTGRNPRTGAAIHIPASKQPKFKAGESLKNAVNNNASRYAA